MLAAASLGDENKSDDLFDNDPQPIEWPDYNEWFQAEVRPSVHCCLEEVEDDVSNSTVSKSDPKQTMWFSTTTSANPNQVDIWLFNGLDDIKGATGEVVDVQSTNEGNHAPHVRDPKAIWAVVLVYSRAERTVMGWAQAQTYLAYVRKPWKLHSSPVLFRFGTMSPPIRASWKDRMYVPKLGFIMIDCHIMHSYVALLLGLDVLRAVGQMTDFGRSMLRSEIPSWTLPYIYRSGHAFFSARMVARIGR